MTDHPMTKTRAAGLWDGVPESVYARDFDKADRDVQDHTTAAMRAAYAAGRVDALASQEGWEPLDWGENPARLGDEVEKTSILGGVTAIRQGVIVSFDDDGDPCVAADGRGLIGERAYGIWRVRRKPLDPLADLTPGTTIRDVRIRWWVEFGAAFISTGADGPCVATAHGIYPLSVLNAFTTADLTTRYTRHGATDPWTAVTLNGETDD